LIEYMLICPSQKGPTKSNNLANTTGKGSDFAAAFPTREAVATASTAFLAATAFILPTATLAATCITFSIASSAIAPSRSKAETSL
jgi:hypothetical protein